MPVFVTICIASKNHIYYSTWYPTTPNRNLFSAYHQAQLNAAPYKIRTKIDCVCTNFTPRVKTSHSPSHGKMITCFKIYRLISETTAWNISE